MKKGISLIVLVITIIVMIIIAGAIIISLNSSNVIARANEAVLKTDVATLNDKLTLAYVDLRAAYPTTDKFDDESVISVVVNGKTISVTGIEAYYEKAVPELERLDKAGDTLNAAGCKLSIAENGSALVEIPEEEQPQLPN